MVKSKKGNWTQALTSLALSLLFIFILRWLFFEPFLIPSGSMEKTLLINDFIFVKKWAYGLRFPFTSKWAFGPQSPKKGEIVVFNSKEQEGMVLIKRVVATGGDLFKFSGDDIQILGPAQLPFETPQVHVTEGLDNETVYKVPEGAVIVMGDNRSHSRDSRYFGAVPLENLLGQASFVWMSCDRLISVETRFCDVSTMRWNRVLQGIQ